MLAEFAERFKGSPDLYKDDNRRPTASINFITAHDGFTLRDLVSYNEKRNEANGEDNQDGESHNRSWNCGTEGPTDDPNILDLRRQQMRNFIAPLFLSQGVPMLVAGDELAKSQLNGHGLRIVDERGQKIVDDNFYVIFNSHYESIDYKLPCAKYGCTWSLIL